MPYLGQRFPFHSLILRLVISTDISRYFVEHFFVGWWSRAATKADTDGGVDGEGVGCPPWLAVGGGKEV